MRRDMTKCWRPVPWEWTCLFLGSVGTKPYPQKNNLQLCKTFQGYRLHKELYSLVTFGHLTAQQSIININLPHTLRHYWLCPFGAIWGSGALLRSIQRAECRGQHSTSWAMATPAIQLPNTPNKLVISQIKLDDDGIYPDGRNCQNMVTKEMNTECELFVNIQEIAPPPHTPNVILYVCRNNCESRSVIQEMAHGLESHWEGTVCSPKIPPLINTMAKAGTHTYTQSALVIGYNVMFIFLSFLSRTSDGLMTCDWKNMTQDTINNPSQPQLTQNPPSLSSCGYSCPTSGWLWWIRSKISLYLSERKWHCVN